MLDITKAPDGLLDPVARVVDAALAVTAELAPDEVMVVGAWCRDILHSALGHTFATTATRDLDLALALSSWDVFRALAAAFPRVGDTGIRFRIVDVDVDLMPFGTSKTPKESSRLRRVVQRSAFGRSRRSSLPRCPSRSHPRRRSTSRPSPATPQQRSARGSTVPTGSKPRMRPISH